MLLLQLDPNPQAKTELEAGQSSRGMVSGQHSGPLPGRNRLKPKTKKVAWRSLRHHSLSFHTECIIMLHRNAKWVLAQQESVCLMINLLISFVADLLGDVSSLIPKRDIIVMCPTGDFWAFFWSCWQLIKKAPGC